MRRSKQNKPCPNKECAFPTLNRQSYLSPQTKKIIQSQSDIDLTDAQICSYCGCVHHGYKKFKRALGYLHDGLWEPILHNE